MFTFQFVKTGTVEAVDPFATAGNAQVIVVTGRAAAGLTNLADGQLEFVDIAGTYLCAAEGLRQQATVVVRQNRQLGLQCTIAQFSVGDARLGGKIDAAELVCGAAIAVEREQIAGVAAAVGLAGASARVQANAQLRYRIKAEADSPLGVARLEVEDKTLAPFLTIGRSGVAAAVVLVEIEIAGIQGGLAVFDQRAGGGRERVCLSCGASAPAAFSALRPARAIR